MVPFVLGASLGGRASGNRSRADIALDHRAGALFRVARCFDLLLCASSMKNQVRTSGISAEIWSACRRSCSAAAFLAVVVGRRRRPSERSNRQGVIPDQSSSSSDDSSWSSCCRCETAGPGIAFLPSIHRPRSTSLQRSEQNGKEGSAPNRGDLVRLGTGWAASANHDSLFGRGAGVDFGRLALGRARDCRSTTSIRRPPAWRARSTICRPSAAFLYESLR